MPHPTEIFYDPICCETHIGTLVMPDFLLAEMGLSVEQLIEQLEVSSK